MTNMEVQEKKALGLTMVSDKESNMTYGVRAQYAADSKESMPIIRLTSNYGNKMSIYKVNICDINPKRASMKNMFALCCHADERGMCEKSSFGTFHTMKQYMKNAARKGICENVTGYLGFLEKELDWTKIADFMRKEFLSLGMYEQFDDCLHIIDMLDYFYTTFHFEEPARRNNMCTEKNIHIIGEMVNDNMARESFCLGRDKFTLEQWKDFLNSYDSISDAISAMMKEEMFKL